jgi:hypothetical protein
MRITRSLTLLMLVFVTGCGIPAPTAAPTPAPTPTPLPSETPPPASAEPSVYVMVDDFEAAETAWQAGTEAFFADSSALSVAVTSENASQGVQALQLTFDKNDKPKAIFFLDRELNLSQAPFLQFDIFNPGSAVDVIVALTTGPESTWYESMNFPLAAGQINRVVFDLSAGDYKAASTNWEFRATIADLNAVHRLAIIITPAASGSVYLDNILVTNEPPVR